MQGKAPLEVLFDGTASSDRDGSISSYRWSFGDQSPDGEGATASHIFQAAGSYTVTLTVTDNTGASSRDSTTVQVTNGDPPTAVAVVTPEVGSAPLEVVFDARDSSDPDDKIVLYQWDFGDGSNPGLGVEVSHVYAEPGTYVASLFVADDLGNSDETLVSVEVTAAANMPPEANFTASPEIGPLPLFVTFDATGSVDPDGVIADYSWNFGDGGVSRGNLVQHTFTAEGVYQVELRVVDNDGAIATAITTIAVGNAPEASFTFAPDAPAADIDLVQFDASASTDDGAIVEYQWDFGDGTTGSGVAAQHTYTRAGEFEVALIVIDDDGIPSAPAVLPISVAANPASLEFRDNFDNASSLGNYTVTTTGSPPDPAVGFDSQGKRMLIASAANATVEVSRSDLPPTDEAIFQLRFLADTAHADDAQFSLSLVQDEDNYYLIQVAPTPPPGMPAGVIQKVVNGIVVGSEPIPQKPKSLPTGYLPGLPYSINVYFSPSRYTVEFTHNSPRVVSIEDPDARPISVVGFAAKLDQQDAFLDEIARSPLALADYYVAFGDSISEGTGDNLTADGRGFPILLQDQLYARSGYTQVVFNEGHGGLKTPEASEDPTNQKRDIDDILARHPKAEFVTYMIGTNDALQQSLTKYGLGAQPGEAAYENSYKDYVQRVITKVIDPSATPPRIMYIAKIPPTTGRLNYANQYIDQYAQVIDELVAENPEIFVAPPDFQCYFSANPQLIADGIHPDGQGYIAIADLWFKMILNPNADTCTLP